MKSIYNLIEVLKVKLKWKYLKKKEAFLKETDIYLNNELNLINNLKKRLYQLSRQFHIFEENYLMLQCIHPGSILKPFLKNDKFSLTNAKELLKEFSNVSKLKVLSLEDNLNYTSAKKAVKYLKKCLKNYDFDLEYQIIPLISFAPRYRIIISFKFNKNLCKKIAIYKLTNMF